MIYGIDEVGRGAWAGPLVVAGVGYGWQDVFRFDEMKKVWRLIEDESVVVGDSKKLSRRQRELSAEWLQSQVEYEVKVGSAIEINEFGMRRVWDELVVGLCGGYEAVVDGTWVPEGCGVRAIPRADETIWEVAAASIIAKVYRDNLMGELAGDFPGYGWERNVGYGTREHREGIRSLGLTPEHRKLWVRKWVV